MSDKLATAHGCLWEIASAVMGLVIGLALVAAFIFGAAYFMGFIG